MNPQTPKTLSISSNLHNFSNSPPTHHSSTNFVSHCPSRLRSLQNQLWSIYQKVEHERAVESRAKSRWIFIKEARRRRRSERKLKMLSARCRKFSSPCAENNYNCSFGCLKTFCILGHATALLDRKPLKPKLWAGRGFRTSLLLATLRADEPLTWKPFRFSSNGSNKFLSFH